MSMSSEEKISPEEFDKELDSLLAGTTEKKPKNPKRKKIIIAAAIYFGQLDTSWLPA